MQKRSFLVLLAVTILLVAAAVATLAAGRRNVKPAFQPRQAFPKLAAELADLTWVRLTHGNVATDLNQINGRWVVVGKANYPAASARVRKLLLGLADLTLIEPKTERPDLYARLGLGDPKSGHSTRVAVQDRAGRSVAELVIGKTRPDWLGGGNDGVYVRRPGDKETWLARGAFDLPDDTAGWLDRDLLDISASRIVKLALTGEDGTALILRRDKPDSDFVVADPPANAKFKDQAALAERAAALAGLELDDVAPRADLPVPQRGVETAAFTTADGLSVTLKLFLHHKADWMAIEANGTGKAAAEAAAINRKLAGWCFAIPEARAHLLRTRLADLLAPPKGS